MNQLLIAISVFSCVVSNILGYPVHDNHHDEGSANIDYSVQDLHTGDVKHQYEVRNKHFVVGSYSLAEPDGTYRIVEYEAYPHKGFNAVVKRIGKAKHPQVYHHNDEDKHKEEHHIDHHDNELGEDFGGIEVYTSHNDEIGEQFGKAKSQVGVTHWGHH